jgi:hypothetical protein
LISDADVNGDAARGLGDDHAGNCGPRRVDHTAVEHDAILGECRCSETTE